MKNPVGLDIHSTRAALTAWYVLVLFLGLAGLAGVVFSLVPYAGLKSFLDTLASDGDFARLTPQLSRALHLPVLVGGCLMLLACALAVWETRLSRNLVAFGLGILWSLAVRLVRDIPRFFSSMFRTRLPAWELAVLLVITGIGLVGRLLFIERGVQYDEAYTYIEFARHSFKHVITDYHHPNNHVLHTLLVHFSTRLFGGALWAIRLPAFTAGLLILPAVYLLGRKMFRPWIGLAAAGLLAVAPVMISYSVNARGYTLIALFTLLLFLLADFARAEKNLAAWSLMILVTALGFYTIPIMLYPFGIVFAWLALAGLLREINGSYGGWKGWLRFLAGYGFLSALLSVFLYSPIFRAKGILNVFNHDPIVRSLSLAEFFSFLPLRTFDIQVEWLTGSLPVWLVTAFLVGAGLSIFLQKRIGRSRVNIPLAALLFAIPTLLVQRPLILPRVWFFLLPLVVLTGLAGWSALLALIPGKPPLRSRFLDAALVLVLAIALWNGGRYLTAAWQNPAGRYFAASDAAALVTRHIKETLWDGDVVVVPQLYDARYWYYFDYYQIPLRHIRDVKRQHFTRVLVIAATSSERTAEEIVRESGPDLGFLRMDTQQETFRAGEFIVVQILPDQALVDKTFQSSLKEE
jgi:hypothetical protein